MSDELRNVSQQWQLTQTFVTIDSTKSWLVAGVDASRWMITFNIVGNFPSSITVSPYPIDLVAGFVNSGFTVSSNPITMTYRDWGGFVGQNWYARTSSGTSTLQVFIASINPNL